MEDNSFSLDSFSFLSCYDATILVMSLLWCPVHDDYIIRRSHLVEMMVIVMLADDLARLRLVMPSDGRRRRDSHFRHDGRHLMMSPTAMSKIPSVIIRLHFVGHGGGR